MIDKIERILTFSTPPTGQRLSICPVWPFTRSKVI
jgi:hypothetical protein